MEIETKAKFINDGLFEINCPASGATFYLDKKSKDHQSKSPSSLEMFLSAVAGCVGVTAKRYLKRKGIDFKEIRVTVKGELSKELPLYLRGISVTVDTDACLGGQKSDFEKSIKNSPVYNTFLNTSKIDISIAQD